MTLREEVLKNAGVINEGFIKKTLATLITALAILSAASKGVPMAKSVYNQYQNASSKSVATKYQEADSKANNNISNWKRNINIYTNYAAASHEPILNIDVKMGDYLESLINDKEDKTNIVKEIESIILSQLDAYVDSIKSNSSKIEKYLSSDTYIGETKPLKVQIDFLVSNSKLNELGKKAESEFEWLSKAVVYDIAREISQKIGINYEYVDGFINGESIAFKK